MQQPDGTIIPSIFSVEHSVSNSPAPGLANFALRVGSVIKIYYPNDPLNHRKDRIEYDIDLKERYGTKGQNVSPYRRCIQQDLFGGLADFMDWSYRPSDNAATESGPTLQTGSTVLVLCLDGDSNHGIIVGGIKHVNTATPNSSWGHFLHFEFNGINIEINKDGELTLTYKSKTDIKGVPQSPDTGGSFVKIDKTGSIEANDNKATSIRLDKPTSDIIITSTKHKIIVNAQDNVEVTTKANTLVTATGKVVVNAQGNVEVTTKANALITASGKATVKAPLVELTNSGTGSTDGVINGTSIDPFTGVPHIDFSSIVRAKK